MSDEALTIEQGLDGVQVTINNPGLLRLILLRGLLILGVAGSGLWLLITSVPLPLMVVTLLLMFSAVPMVLLLGAYLHGRLYEARIVAGQLTLQSGTLRSLTVPLDGILAVSTHGRALVLRHRTPRGTERTRRFHLPLPADRLAGLITESIAHARPTGDRSEVPAALAALRREKP